jgi:hypothetical protein
LLDLSKLILDFNNFQSWSATAFLNLDHTDLLFALT